VTQHVGLVTRKAWLYADGEWYELELWWLEKEYVGVPIKDRFIRAINADLRGKLHAEACEVLRGHMIGAEEVRLIVPQGEDAPPLIAEGFLTSTDTIYYGHNAPQFEVRFEGTPTT
jgi:hypothetical protein